MGPDEDFAAEPNIPLPALGTLARDTKQDRLGVVMSHQQGQVQLRAVKGGLEWDADPGQLLPTTLSEELRPLVREANERSRKAL